MKLFTYYFSVYTFCVVIVLTSVQANGFFRIRRFQLQKYEIFENVNPQHLFASILESSCINKHTCISVLNYVLFEKESSNPQYLIRQNLLYKTEAIQLYKHMSKGLLSQIVVRLLKLQNKDLGYLLFRTNRYAYRICNDTGFFQDTRGNASECVTGRNFIAIMTRLKEILPKS